MIKYIFIINIKATKGELYFCNNIDKFLNILHSYINVSFYIYIYKLREISILVSIFHHFSICFFFFEREIKVLSRSFVNILNVYFDIEFALFLRLAVFFTVISNDINCILLDWWVEVFFFLYNEFHYWNSQ